MRCAMLVSVVVIVGGSVGAAEMPKFKTQEIDKTLKIGYGVILADINGDSKQDIVVADKERVVWFENPSWKLNTILTGKTKTDNVCLDAADIDGDGKIDLALGAGWRPADTKNPGTLQWLRRPKTGNGEWEMFEIANEEPTIHRIRWADLEGDGKKELISVPLQGKGAPPANNFGDGKVRVFAYRPGGDPTQPKWEKELLCDQFPVMHNFQAVDFDGDGKLEVLTASYEGVNVLKKGADGKWGAK
ncbi:MAG TPA: VCBS repeat-containing protein, partial [Tepidisphaeraceae bacterium]|nr:VCBS repeat-containing protein [Tepidisphaeraceae bacterium]